MDNVRVLRRNESAFSEAMRLARSGDFRDYSHLGESLHVLYGVQDSPKRGLLLVTAIHYGINGGATDIVERYDELVNLIK